MAPPHNYQICNFSPLRMKKEFCAIFHLRELVFPRDKEMLPVLPYTSVYVTCCKLLLLAGYQHQYHSRHHLPLTTSGNQWKKISGPFFCFFKVRPGGGHCSLFSAHGLWSFCGLSKKSLLKVCNEKIRVLTD